MSKNTSILLGEYFDNFVKEQVATGRFSSVSEVVRTALRLFEQEEKKAQQIILALEKGEKSGFVDDFNPQDYLKDLHSKHIEE